jgi:hypothetical protein
MLLYLLHDLRPCYTLGETAMKLARRLGRQTALRG